MNPNRPLNFKKAGEDGFTFIELLVVLATVAVLAVLLLPAIAGTKPNSQAFQCLENQRQLILSWQMYAEDNTDLLPPNDSPYFTAYASSANKSQLKNWVVGTMEQALDARDAPASMVGGVSELLDPNTLLSPYITNKLVYHCPADNYKNPLNNNRVNVRSYSMNSAVGTVWYTSSAYTAGGPPLGTAVQGGWLPGSSYNANQTSWLTYGKMSSFTGPGPANTFVIMDENPISINDGSTAIPAATVGNGGYLIDYPSGNHGESAAVAFADGHVIIHKWQNPETYTPIVSQGQGGNPPAQPLTDPNNPDLAYLAHITSAPR